VQAPLAIAIGSADRDKANFRAKEELVQANSLPAIRGASFVLLSDAGSGLGNFVEEFGQAAARLSNQRESFELDLQLLRDRTDQGAFVSSYLTNMNISNIRASRIFLYANDRISPIDPDAVSTGVIFDRIAGGLQEWRNLPSLSMESSTSSGLIYSGYSAYGTYFYYSPTVQEGALEALGRLQWILDDPPPWPAYALNWLSTNLDDLPQDNKESLVSALWRIVSVEPSAIEVLLDLIGTQDFFNSLPSRIGRDDPRSIGLALLDAEQGKHTAEMREYSRQMTQYVVAVLRNSRDEAGFKLASEWVSRRAAELDPDLIENLRRELNTVSNRSSGFEAKNSARLALIELDAQKRKVNTLPLIELLRGDDQEKALQALDDLDRLTSTDAPRAMVEEWVSWLALRDRALLVESAAEKLRKKPQAVLPILDFLQQPLPLAINGLKASLQGEFISSDIETILAFRGRLGLSERARLQRWFNTIAGGDGLVGGLMRDDEPDRDEINTLIAKEIELRRSKREREVHRRLARHLTEMSEGRFFEEGSNVFEQVQVQLRMHAIPLLGRRLIDEEDVDIRESMARALGSVGGREAVDALARAVAGEERTRASRQELLSRYYLEPSKARSDQAAEILTEAVSEARRTLRILQRLNFVFAGIGLVFLTVGLATLFYSNDPQLQFAGGFISVTAFFGLVLQIIREPLNRIQEAMNRLVQLETAFTSFIWELNLNGTYIQSQYVARGVLDSMRLMTLWKELRALCDCRWTSLQPTLITTQCRLLPL
jgi:hypothetical protein